MVHQGLIKINSMDIIWSYSVTFRKSDTLWATRWDPYLKMRNSRVHWFQIVNSFIIVILLSASIAMILTRTLKQDLLKYKDSLKNDVEKQRLINGHKMDKDTIIIDEFTDYGWKIVHGDVFRPPKHSYFFIILISSGFQTFLMTLSSIVFSALGFASPAIRGSLINDVFCFLYLDGLMVIIQRDYINYLVVMKSYLNDIFSKLQCFILRLISLYLFSLIWGYGLILRQQMLFRLGLYWH